MNLIGVSETKKYWHYDTKFRAFYKSIDMCNDTIVVVIAGNYFDAISTVVLSLPPLTS